MDEHPARQFRNYFLLDATTVIVNKYISPQDVNMALPTPATPSKAEREVRDARKFHLRFISMFEVLPKIFDSALSLQERRVELIRMVARATEAASLRIAAENASKQQNGLIRIRKSLGLGKRRNQNTDEGAEGINYNTEHGAPQRTMAENCGAAFFDRYAVTVSHHQITTEVSFDEIDDDSIELPLPGVGKKALLPVVPRCEGDETMSKSREGGLMDDLFTYWGDGGESQDGGGVAADDGGDSLQDTVDESNDESATTMQEKVADSARNFDLSVFVHEFGDVLYDCTYFFRCFGEEAVDRLLTSSPAVVHA